MKGKESTNGCIAARITDLRAGVSRQSFLSHPGKKKSQLWHAAGNPLPPAIGRGDRFLFSFAKQEIEFVKKDLHYEVMENSCLWQSMENKLSLTVCISLFRSFIREILTC